MPVAQAHQLRVLCCCHSILLTTRRSGKQNVASAGSSGLIQRLPWGNVRKCVYSYPDCEACLLDLECEFQIYRNLPQHDWMLKLIRYSPEEGLVLQYMPRGSLRQHLRDGIIHSDLKPENLLMDSNSRQKLIHFSGSSFDGIVGSAIESTRFFLPRPLKEPPTARTDLFALGSTSYEIMTGSQPYEDLLDEEVEVRYSQQIFPSLQVIMDCWPCGIHSAEQVIMLLKAQMENVLELH